MINIAQKITHIDQYGNTNKENTLKYDISLDENNVDTDQFDNNENNLQNNLIR